MPDVRYQNFDLTIQKEGKGYKVSVDSPAGQASGRFKVPFSALELENFILTTTPGRRSVRRVDTPEVAAAKKFGERLFNAVFTGEVAGRFHTALNDAYHSDDRLRIRLRLTDVPELADLPWEYLYNPPLNRFLALDDDTALVRYLELPERVRPVTVQLPLRVLVAISNPNDYPRLDVEQEWTNLNGALSGLEREGLLDLDLLEDAALPSLPRQLSKREYHIFHFIGHGGFDRQTEEGVMVFKDEQGRGRLVSGQQLGWLMHNHKTLALAVLNACEGARADSTDVFAGTAQSLVQQGIPAVVAMQREVTDDAAKTFARAFYSAVAEGKPVEAALTETRLAIFAEGHGLEWATPVLYMRAPDGRVFDLQVAPAPRIHTPPVAVEETYTVMVNTGSGEEVASSLDTAHEDQEKAQESISRTGRERAQEGVQGQSKVGTQKAGWMGSVVPALGALAAIVLLAVVFGWVKPFAGSTPASPTPTVGSSSVPTLPATGTFALMRTLTLPATLPVGAVADAVVFSGDSSYVASRFYMGDDRSVSANMGQIVVWPVLGYPIQAEWAVGDYDRLYPQMEFVPTNSTDFTIGQAYDLALAEEGGIAIRSIGDTTTSRSISITDVISLGVSSDGKVLAAGARGGVAGLWDPKTGSLVHDLTGHQGKVESVAFSPSGEVLATTEFRQTRIWDVQTGNFQYAITHSLANVPGTTKTVFAHDGKSVAICSSAADCGFWRLSDGGYIGSLESELDRSDLGKMLAVGFSQDDRTFAIGWEDGVVQLWKDGALQDTLRADLGGERVSAMAFSSDLRLVAFALRNNHMRIWSLP